MRDDSRDDAGTQLMRGALLAACLLAFAAAADAGVRISNVWSRATPPGTTVGVVYGELSAEQADELTSIESAVAERVEVHVSSNEGGTMKMRPLTSVALPAKQRVRFQPGGMHVMLIGLRRPLMAGATLPLTFKFRSAAPLRIEARIIGPGEREPAGN
jgi:copper(I)-binding protein